MSGRDCWQYRDRMVELATGPADPEGRRELEGHLEVCADCRAEWESLQEVVAAVREVPEPAVPAGFWDELDRALARHPAVRRRTAPWALGLKVAALAALAALATLQGTPPARVTQSTVVSPAVHALLPHVEDLAQAWGAALEVEVDR